MDELEEKKMLWDRVNKLPIAYRRLALRVSISCASLLFSLVGTVLMIYIMQEKPLLQFVFCVFAVLLSGLLVQGFTMMVRIIKEGRRIKTFIKTGIYQIPPPK